MPEDFANSIASYQQDQSSFKEEPGTASTTIATDDDGPYDTTYGVDRGTFAGSQSDSDEHWDADWHLDFANKIASIAPIQTEEQAEARRQAEAAREAQDGAAFAAEQSADEENAEPSPLDAFPDEQVQEVCEGLGITAEMLAENPQLQETLAAKLQEIQPQLTQQQEANRQQEISDYFRQMEAVANDPSLNDPEVMAAWTDQLGQALGWSDVENVPKLAQTLAAGGLNLLAAATPRLMSQLLPEILNQHAPGLLDMYREAQISRICRRVSASRSLRSGRSATAASPFASGKKESGLRSAIEEYMAGRLTGGRGE